MTDIGPGDLVVCVDADPATKDGQHCAAKYTVFLVEGRHYRVRRIETNGVAVALRLHGDPLPPTMWGGYAVIRFRKIDRADDSFTEQVRKCRPIKTREPVPC